MSARSTICWTRSQIIVVSHSDPLIATLADDGDTIRIVLDKQCGETIVVDHDPPPWTWPSR